MGEESTRQLSRSQPPTVRCFAPDTGRTSSHPAPRALSSADVVHAVGAAAPAPRHAVQFYEDDDCLTDAIARLVIGGLVAGEPVVLIATPNHLEAVRRRAVQMGANLTAAVDDGRLAMHDARATLSAILAGPMPDPQRFRLVIGGFIARSAAAANGGPVRAYSDMVEMLWRERNAAAAIRLEELWNELASRFPFSMLCASSLAVFEGEEDAAGFDALCAAHDLIIPAEPAGDDAEPRRDVGELQQRVTTLGTEIARHQRAERSLRQSNEELLDFVENAPVALRWVGADGRIVWANQAELDLVGHARDEYVGRLMSAFFVDSETSRDLLERLGRNEPVRDYPVRVRRKDGSIRHVLIDANGLWRDGVFVHGRCFTRDVTAQVEAHAEQAARERFRELFIGMLGHDLRNPLGAITTGAEVLAMRGARSDGERLDETSAKIVARIARSAARMARMIDQVLDFARLNAGTGIPLNPQPIDLFDVCATVVDELKALHPNRDVHVDYIGDSSGCWDLDRLSQVFSNLIGNALAYGDPGEPIQILITQDGADVVVRVHNMGPPIPPHIMPTVFDPYRRAQPQRTGAGGLGLGLYITKEIVQGHGGTIDVTSTEEDGTIFRVRLPQRCQDATVAAHAGAPEWPEVAMTRARPRARVLVVEDDEDSAEVLREVLEGLGHDVRVVRDGLLALAEAQRFDPDVVLLDLGLPTMNGVEVARRLRATTARARIIALTGHGPAAVSGVEFDAYLVKPADVAALTSAMKAPETPLDPASAGDGAAPYPAEPPDSARRLTRI